MEDRLRNSYGSIRHQGGKSAALTEDTVKADGVHRRPKEHFSSSNALMPRGQTFEQSPCPSRNRKLPSSRKLLEVSSLPNPSVTLGSPHRAPALKLHRFQVALLVKNPPANAREEMRVRSLGWEDPLEEGMAAHFNILAWRILWTEEPGRLQSIRS